MKKLISLIIFGIAFGLLEAIVVFYIRTIVGHTVEKIQLPDQYTILLDLKFIAFILFKQPILENARITSIEIAREFSTIVMLLTLAYASGETLRQRIGAFLISFAFWDIFYYVFLYVLIGWPKSPFDIDIYFIIPVPWVGPIITPVIISIILIIIGIKLYLFKKETNKN